jgi:hypothetical protein
MVSPLLALVIAARRLPAPLSAVLVTSMVAARAPEVDRIPATTTAQLAAMMRGADRVFLRGSVETSSREFSPIVMIALRACTTGHSEALASRPSDHAMCTPSQRLKSIRRDADTPQTECVSL